jgi:hypothetical protein
VVLYGVLLTGRGVWNAHEVFFMVLTSYIFGIIGTTVLGRNDPFHFGDLPKAMLSLFRVSTLEDWTDIMYYNMYGCEGWGFYQADSAHNSTAAPDAVTTVDCVHEPFPIFSVVFFVSYICITTYLLLNLFVGIIVETMFEINIEAKERALEAKAWAAAKKMDTGMKMNAGISGAAAGVKKVASKVNSVAQDASPRNINSRKGAETITALTDAASAAVRAKKGASKFAKKEKNASGKHGRANTEIDFDNPVPIALDNPLQDADG